MNSAEANEIAGAIAKAMVQERVAEKKMLVDPLMRLLVALGNAGIIGLFIFCFNINTSLTRIDTVQNSSLKQMEQVQEYMKEPRFTSESFKMEIQPIAQTVLGHDRSIERHNEWAAKMDAVSAKHEQQLNILIEDLGEIKNLLRERKQ